VALDRQGRIYVSDTGKNRVLRLGRDGAVERQWGATGDLLSRPVGIAVSGQGEVYVADTGHRRIAVFTADGTLLRAWPIHGWSADVLQEPYLQVGGDGSVWVTDPSGKRVLVFASDGRPLGSARASTSLSIPVGIALFDDTHAVVGDAGTQSLVLVSRTANTSVVPK
jgi:sugar lactone lactonase YvrE